jgi:hypothetical protein
MEFSQFQPIQMVNYAGIKKFLPGKDHIPGKHDLMMTRQYD